MADVSDADLAKFVRFAESQMNKNPAGIGNECTHFVYAGLFEIRAMDGALQRNATVNTANNHLHWGRPIDPTDAKPGDIVQFWDHHENFLLWSRGGGMRSSRTLIRGPLHTAVVATPADSANPGGFIVYECHVHTDPSLPLMQIRMGTINYQSYSLEVPDTSLHPQSLTFTNFVLSGIEKALETSPNDTLDKLTKFPAYLGRSTFGISDTDARKLETAITSKSMQLPSDVGAYFRVKQSGMIQIYRPQISNDRRAMRPDALASEKTKLIAALQKGGRAGHSPTEDNFGGDNKARRVKDHRFDWTFVDQPSRGFPLPALP